MAGRPWRQRRCSPRGFKILLAISTFAPKLVATKTALLLTSERVRQHLQCIYCVIDGRMAPRKRLRVRCGRSRWSMTALTYRPGRLGICLCGAFETCLDLQVSWLSHLDKDGQSYSRGCARMACADNDDVPRHCAPVQLVPAAHLQPCAVPTVPDRRRARRLHSVHQDMPRGHVRYRRLRSDQYGFLGSTGLMSWWSWRSTRKCSSAHLWA